MKRLWLIPLSLALALAVVGQTVNMGRTYVASQNVRYANEGATGTTLNKLAKLTGAPSTAIITATADTAGIVGIVVAGAGTTGSADIAFAGKASCVFDGATTAGHYVINSNTAAGECKDGGATYPTSGQVIGVVTSTNGGTGTYEVDLTLRQPHVGAGSFVQTHAVGCGVGDPVGSALSTGVLCYVVVPVGCTIQSWDILVDSGTATVDIWQIGTGTAIPAVGNTITAAALPAIAANTAIHSTTMTSWATTHGGLVLAQYDILGFNLTSTSGPKYIYAGLNCDESH